MDPNPGDPVGLMESAYLGNKGILDRINREMRNEYANKVANYKADYPVAVAAKATDPATVLPEKPVPPKQFDLQHDAFIAAFSLFESRLTQYLLGNGKEPEPLNMFDSAVESTMPDALAGWTPEGPSVPVPDMPVGGFMFETDDGKDVYGVAAGAQDILQDGDEYEPLAPTVGGPVLVATKKRRFGGIWNSYWTKTVKGTVPWPGDPKLNTPDAKKAKPAPAKAAK